MKRIALMVLLAGVAPALVPGCSKKPARPRNPLPEMVRQGDRAGLEKIIDTPGAGQEALMLAAQFGKADLLDLLFEHGAEAKTGDADGITPLHRAAQGGHVEVARILIARGARLNARDLLGGTPLDYAAGAGQTEMVALLKSKGGRAGGPRR
jgi:ankyrin repeat protein